jgi:hypothetical protein
MRLLWSAKEKRGVEMARHRPSLRKRRADKYAVEKRISEANERQQLIDAALRRLEQRGTLLPSSLRERLQ